MFKIESYVTPILLSYVDKYVRDFKPADAQVSLWGGGVALHNLVLKADVLQQEVALPFTLVSGRIHELLIQVPWTKIISEPIIVTIDTIECVLSLNPPATQDDTPAPERRAQVVEAPPGYMQALVRRVVSNIALRVHHLIIKYVQDDIVLSLNVKHLAVDSAGVHWEPAFADIDPSEPVIRRLVRLDDLTLCLDRADSDGKIRFYQEPLLYRCQLDFRVLTRLVSANTRRASSLSVHLRSTKLAWGVSTDQLILLLRLLRERPSETKTPPPAPKTEPQPLHITSSNSAEPARQESWSEWAWSWLPTWMDRDGAAEEAPTPAAPIPVHFVAYLDVVSFVFKVMELESSVRKRAQPILELTASHAAIKSFVRAPTMTRVRIGLRTVSLLSRGKCICGHVTSNTTKEESAVYLRKIGLEDVEPWVWPDEDLADAKVELAQEAGAEDQPGTTEINTTMTEEPEGDVRETVEPNDSDTEMEDDVLWRQMAPVLMLQHWHERTPPQPYDNPYESPPADFQYSDWAEVCTSKLIVQPIELRLCCGLLHRLSALKKTFQELTPPAADLPKRTLTVEECEALQDNLPQKRFTIDMRELRVCVEPWNHTPGDRPMEPPLTLEILLPKALFVITGPLYPHRVCSAACQMPGDSGPLWEGARLRVWGTLPAASAYLTDAQGTRKVAPTTAKATETATGATETTVGTTESSAEPTESKEPPVVSKACARADLRMSLRILLHPQMFCSQETVLISYSFKIREANVCGSRARLQAAYEAAVSLLTDRSSHLLRHSSLCVDALNDQRAVAIDFTLEELSARGYLTKDVNTHIVSVHSARATAYHAPKVESVAQAWLFSAPDVATTTQYFRATVQWCSVPMPNSLDYIGIWTEPISFCLDPLFIAWLAYKPTMKPSTDSSFHVLKSSQSTHYLLRRRPTPPSSSGKGGSRSGSGAELVHVRGRSVGSSSEPERREIRAQPTPATFWNNDRLLELHERLRRTLVNVELGLVLVYAASSSASALDCATVRDAIERHASDKEPVLVLSMGKVSVQSNSNNRHLWHEIRHDGPTFITPSPEPKKEDDDCFPWRMRFVDMSCYTLESSLSSGSERYGRSNISRRSQLKTTYAPTPRTVLELVTTTVTLSVVTKAMQIKTTVRRDQKKRASATWSDKTKYFTTGEDFKPASLKEFFRGPAKRTKSTTEDNPDTPQKQPSVEQLVTQGPVVSLGAHVHADTPPLVVRLTHDQVHVVATAIHGVQHILTLLQQKPPSAPARVTVATSLSQRSVSEMDELRTPSEESPSEARSEQLISIFESMVSLEPVQIKTFFWFQWVVSRATLVVATHNVKLAFDIDDIICTVDVQPHYNQLKVKVASASVRHHERTGTDEWTAGVLGGRVLEAREPTNAVAESHFISITITQAQISNLPANWKDELHPKLLEQTTSADSMWEIYATVAPLEAVVQPTVLENIMSVAHEFAPRAYCVLQAETNRRASVWQWPYLYVEAGGMRLLLTSDDEYDTCDDTFIFNIGKVTVSPHPENPICRRTVNAGTDTTWTAGGTPFEGHQYEVLVHNCGILSTQLRQIVSQEYEDIENMTENPAVKWTQPVKTPLITPILHSIDVGCVLAPALFLNGLLVCGPAVELNLVSDCSVEMSVKQLGLLQRVLDDLHIALEERPNTYYTQDHSGVCPYATLLTKTKADPSLAYREATVTAEAKRSVTEVGPSSGTDSGVGTTGSSATRLRQEDSLGKKTASVVFIENPVQASEYLEVFVTMGAVEMSLYTADDNGPVVEDLRVPTVTQTTAPSPTTPASPAPPPQVNIIYEEKETKGDTDSVGSRTRSLTENVRTVDAGNSKLRSTPPQARRGEGNIPLLHLTLHQPNLYYWRRKTQISYQVSLFNAWLGLGGGQTEGQWREALLSTARGVLDPATDIPPALITMRLSTHIGSRGSLKVDIERPVQIEVCTDRIRRIKGIITLIKEEIGYYDDEFYDPTPPSPLLFKVRHAMAIHSVDLVTIQCGQMSLCGSEGVVGFDGASVQMNCAGRAPRLGVRVAVWALLVTVGAATDRRRVLLQPVTIGLNMEANWEPWRRIEGGAAVMQPSVRLNVDLDQLVVDLRPEELETLSRLHSYFEVQTKEKNNSGHITADPAVMRSSFYPSSVSSTEGELLDHYYQDDLRTGAFKMVSGGQLPMAYQVTLAGASVAWRYPHPRAVTRLVTFPLPKQNEVIECVLEFYGPMLNVWHPYAFFNIPVNSPKETLLCATAPDAVFAQMWRYRPCSVKDVQQPPFVFEIKPFLPREESLLQDKKPEMDIPKSDPRAGTVTAEQLSGVVRVDSYFAPKAMPKVRVSARLANCVLYLHNSLPLLSSQATALEGYYVSRPLMRSHRVLALMAKDANLHAHFGSPAGSKAALSAIFESDVCDSGTGCMELMVRAVRVRAGVVNPARSPARVRVHAAHAHVALHVPRLRTLHALAADWAVALNLYKNNLASPQNEKPHEKLHSKREVAEATAASLEGRVSLWVHNSCAASLRLGQHGTDELAPLGPGARLAYRWRCPSSKKRLRIALASPSADWHWSSNVPFVPGTYRVRLEDAEALGSKTSPGGGVYAHIKVEEHGAQRTMHISGRLALANMLRYNLLYKIRARCPDASQWKTVCSGELEAETVGRSVLCGANCEMVLKIKFGNRDIGWSGDIPLKECPKENVPWLVKVPSEGEVPYVSVWCRVVRARSDGRVLACVWPLYVLTSLLPLDSRVLIKTEPMEGETDEPTPLEQQAAGQGHSSHLLAPGTTANRHSLSFQYKNIDCPVTREAVPLHYGVTDTSVFDKRTPVNDIEEVIQEILAWLQRSGRNATITWPYSVVSKHWPGTWEPAQLQPRCDVTVRYQAVRAGGGCSLELRLCPATLLCNAAPVTLTLRAHDAAPLCALHAGAVVSAPSALLQKPFFISIDIGRETFVSGQLQVSSVEPGRYGTPPAGHVTLEHPAPFAVHCNHKVALLTMYYEIKEDINVLGASTTYELMNHLETSILVSAIVVTDDSGTNLPLHPKSFKVVEPIKESSVHGTPLCRFWLSSRWRGEDPGELSPYICVALAGKEYPASTVPVKLGVPPYRRAFCLHDKDKLPIPVVVCQVKSDGRWIVGVARDPCPQFVVHNLTKEAIAIAQPTAALNESTSNVMAVNECEGVRWWCSVEAGGVAHYSSPAHCERYPPPAAANAPRRPQLLTFGRYSQEFDPYWCSAVAVTEGEQLLQLYGGATYKLRTRVHLHSTLLELRPVEQTDISASDIRKRLLEPYLSIDTMRSQRKGVDIKESDYKLERINADEKLLEKSIAVDEQGEESLDPFEADAESLLLPKKSSEMSKDQKHSTFNTDSQTVYPGTSSAQETTSEADNDNGAEQLLILKDSSKLLAATPEPDVANENTSAKAHRMSDTTTPEDVEQPEWQTSASWSSQQARCVIEGLTVELAGSDDSAPLLAVHLDRAALCRSSDDRGTKTTISIAGVQVDNLQYESGQFDFSVVASALASSEVDGVEGKAGENCAAVTKSPPLWSLLVDENALSTRQETARVLLHLRHDDWTVLDETFHELGEVELSVGPLALYVEDAYVRALVRLARAALPAPAAPPAPLAAELRALRRPLLVRALHVHALDLTLTLHTAVRMYIALDQSPLRLGAFKLTDAMTSVERLTHALTVHYLSAAILGAGWVVGGLELLGAPGALAARVGCASGGVRGVAAAAAAALVRSLSACAGSLARNLDLLAGDTEHALRAAAARRRAPPSLAAGLLAGLGNLAVNILGAVGGLAHHPLVGVAVGETDSGAAALRRSLVGALTKPLSATADLVAYAGHGLLTQTGWDPVPQNSDSCVATKNDHDDSARASRWTSEGGMWGDSGLREEWEGWGELTGWRRDCVRWTFRLAELPPIVGFEALLNNAALHLLFTHKFLVVADPETERVVEMIDFKLCSLGPYQGPIIELSVKLHRSSKNMESRAVDVDDEFQISAAAMARVARYTGAETGSSRGGTGAGSAATGPSTGVLEGRTLCLIPAPYKALALHSALAAAVRHNSESHFPLL